MLSRPSCRSKLEDQIYQLNSKLANYQHANRHTYIHTYIQIRHLEEGLGCSNAFVVVFKVGYFLPLISIFPRQRHIVRVGISNLAKQLSNGDWGSCRVALFTYPQRQRGVNITGPLCGLRHCLVPRFSTLSSLIVLSTYSLVPSPAFKMGCFSAKQYVTSLQ